MRQPDSPGLLVLNPSQENLLWIRALESAAASGQSLSVHATGIRRAAVLLREWNIARPAAGANAASDEAGALALGLARFTQLCGELHVVAAGVADDAVLDLLPVEQLAFAGFASLTPRQARIAQRFAIGGAHLQCLQLPEQVATPRIRSGKDWREEARAAGQWAAALLRELPSRRLLIVSANRQLDSASLQSILLEELAPLELLQGRAGATSILAIEGGNPLDRSPLVRAALTLLSLGQGNVDFAVLSAVLLSPHADFGDGSTAARLELWVRNLGRARFDWLHLRPALLAAPGSLQTVAQRLIAAVDSLRSAFANEQRLSAEAWAERVLQQLAACGFLRARTLDSQEQQLHQRWQELLEEFASLDAVTGAMTWHDALQTLQALAARLEHQAATGDAAVTLSVSRDDPVIHYDGIWVMGLEESLWPEPLRPDAFVPLAAQRNAGIPAASVSGRLSQARHQLDAMRARTNELVLSYPRQDADLHKRPSPLLNGFASPAEDIVLDPTPGMQPGQASDRIRDEWLPALAAAGDPIVLRAGTRLPELQGACAFRAQAELRLAAQRPESPAEGIEPRLRGQLLHQTLERVWRVLGDRQKLRTTPAEALRVLVVQSIRQAQAALVSKSPLPFDVRVWQRERARAERLALALLKLEATRSDFRIEALESLADLAVDGARLRLRIDRIDRLPDGSVAILDYKGASGTIDLLGERPQPVQLMAYLAALESAAGDARTVSALALVKFAPAKVSFIGVADSRERLPFGRHTAIGDWDAQRTLWRSAVETLVRSHVAGDARVDPAPDVCRYCHLPALCRIGALARLALETEDAEDE